MIILPNNQQESVRGQFVDSLGEVGNFQLLNLRSGLALIGHINSKFRMDYSSNVSHLPMLRSNYKH